MRYMAAQTVVTKRAGEPRVTGAFPKLLAAPNSYHLSRYSIVKHGAALRILPRLGEVLAMLHGSAQGGNSLTAFADRFTGGATINSLTDDADRTTGGDHPHPNRKINNSLAENSI